MTSLLLTSSSRLTSATRLLRFAGRRGGKGGSGGAGDDLVLDPRWLSSTMNFGWKAKSLSPSENYERRKLLWTPSSPSSSSPSSSSPSSSSPSSSSHPMGTTIRNFETQAPRRRKVTLEKRIQSLQKSGLEKLEGTKLRKIWDENEFLNRWAIEGVFGFKYKHLLVVIAGVYFQIAFPHAAACILMLYCFYVIYFGKFFKK